MINNLKKLLLLFSLPAQLLRCFFKILITPKYLLPLIIPYIIGIISFILFSSWGISLKERIASLLISTESSWHTFLSWTIVPVLILLCSILSIIIVLLFAETFIELFLEQAFPRYNLQIKNIKFKEFLGYVIRTIKNDTLRILMVLFLTIITIICGLIPLLLFIPPLIAAFLTGFDLINLPLAMLDKTFIERWRLARKNLIETIALGATFLIFLLIPFGGILFLPAGYLLATERLSKWKDL